LLRDGVSGLAGIASYCWALPSGVHVTAWRDSWVDSKEVVLLLSSEADVLIAPFKTYSRWLAGGWSLVESISAPSIGHIFLLFY